MNNKDDIFLSKYVCNFKFKIVWLSTWTFFKLKIPTNSDFCNNLLFDVILVDSITEY